MVQYTDKLYYRGSKWATRLGTCAQEDTIVLTGAPRSGTTLLLEVLHGLDGYKALNEPLQMRYAERHGFSHRTVLEPGQPAPAQRAYLQAVCSGQLGPAAPWLFEASTRWGRLAELARRRKLVVKFCRLSRMLHWFDDAFDVRGIVYIIRHPCATVSSMMTFGAWTHALERKGVAGFPLDLGSLPADVQERFRPVIERIDTPEEAMAAIWCLDNYLALLHHTTHPWILVPYERLVQHGVRELERITDALDVRLNEPMVKALDRPSSSARKGLRRDPKVQLSKWRDQLSVDQIDRIMRIVEAAGLAPFYTDDPEPCYARLNELQDPRWRWDDGDRAADVAEAPGNRQVANEG